MDKRQKELAQASLNAEKTVLRDLERQYRRALEDVDEKIKAFAADIDRLEQAIDAETDDKQKEILISRSRSKVYQKQYQEALQGQLDGILEKMHGDNYQTIEQYLKDCYEDAYIGTLYELQGQGVPLIMPIDQAAAVKAIQLDTKLKEDLYKSLDIKALKETIRREITRGIASGMTWQQIARNIHNQSTAPKSRAKLIARTEGHRIQSAGQYNAQVDAKKRGADVVKQWSAILDGRTREHHRQLDGQIKEVDEPFEIDSRRKAMFPGGFGRPEEDCNCRCRSNTRARWALEAPQTKMLGNTDGMTDKQLKPIAEKLHIPVDELRKYSGQIIPLEAKDFEDFKRQYNQIWNYDNRANYVAPVSEKWTPTKTPAMRRDPAQFRRAGSATKAPVTETTQDYRKATTMAEAIEYAKGYTKMGEFAVDGLHLNTVNGFNEAMNNVVQRFGKKLNISGLKPVKKADAAYMSGAYDDKTRLISLKGGNSSNALSGFKQHCEKYFANGWISTNDGFGTFYHEIGHAVWSDLSSAAKAEIKKLYQDTKHSAYMQWMDMGGSRSGMSQAEIFGKSLSRYALTDEQEFFSEAFAQIMAGRMRPVSRQVNSVLTKYYKTTLEKDIKTIELRK